MSYAPALTRALAASAVIAGVLAVPLPAPAQKSEGKWVSLMDGKTLKGWHVSAQTGHSGASGFKSGGKWVVEKGAFIGSQDIPGNGGIIITDKQFGDFEVCLEMKNDYGPDSGLFLRSTEKGQCYQAMIDYHDNGNLMGVYGEGIGAFLARNFVTGATPDKIRTTVESAFPLRFSPEEWPKIWKHGRWNRLKARITGNPPTIHTWINGRKIMEFTDTQKRLPDTGGIALQVHGGGDFTKQFVRYRKVRVKEL